jgi:cobalamin biosynthesis Mg chelatase CobN
MSSQPDTDPNASHLKEAIDRGEGGDKVPFADPAAAPLGTDDEAAGTPNTTAQVEQSLSSETRNRKPERDANASATAPTNVSVGPTASRSDMPAHAPWVAVAVLIVVVLGVFLGMEYFGLLT